MIETDIEFKLKGDIDYDWLVSLSDFLDKRVKYSHHTSTHISVNMYEGEDEIVLTTISYIIIDGKRNKFLKSVGIFEIQGVNFIKINNTELKKILSTIHLDFFKELQSSIKEKSENKLTINIPTIDEAIIELSR